MYFKCSSVVWLLYGISPKWIYIVLHFLSVLKVKCSLGEGFLFYIRVSTIRSLFTFLIFDSFQSIAFSSSMVFLPNNPILFETVLAFFFPRLCDTAIILSFYHILHKWFLLTVVHINSTTCGLHHFLAQTIIVSPADLLAPQDSLVHLYTVCRFITWEHITWVLVFLFLWLPLS